MVTDLKLAKRLLFHNTDKLAFIIGNGINRYAYKGTELDTSWSALLLKAWKGASYTTLSSIDSGITFTEFYDIMELESNSKDVIYSIINDIRSWNTTDYHRRLCAFFERMNMPVLTTNFDMLLESFNSSKHIVKHPNISAGFTSYYPWNVVYTNSSDFELHDIYGFGIWHINGMIEYPSSLKLSLSSYTRQSKRAIEFLHTKSLDDDFSGKNKSEWRGMNTWLHLIFNCDLCIFGLGLDEQEIFLRWLLIERMKYFKKNPEKKRRGWYICKKKELTSGKQFFLEKIGFEIIELKSYKEIFEGLML